MHFGSVSYHALVQNPVNLPSPLAWCKAFYAGDNSSIYQILLDRTFRVRNELGERQDGVNSSQGFN